ncbi:MAG: hypothetical protein IK077_15680 [Thermoguttaceae bacterium]|nr:hypothetical protein [Thermoguttaceae bacterium]
MKNSKIIFKAFNTVAFLVVLTFLGLLSFAGNVQAQAPSNAAQSLRGQWKIQKDGENCEYTFEALFNDDKENTPQAPVISKIIVKDSYIYASADNKRIYRFDLENDPTQDNNRGLKEVFGDANSWIRAIATAPGLDEIAAISQKGQMFVFLVKNGTEQTIVKKCEALVETRSAHDVVYSPDGEYLAVCGTDPYISIYKVNRSADKETIDVSLWKKLSVTNSASTAIQFSPDGKMLAVGDRNGVVRVWRFDDGKLTGPFLKLTLNDENTGVGRRIRAVAFNAASSLIAVGGDHSKILVYDANTGDLVSRLILPSAESENEDNKRSIDSGKGMVYSLVFCGDRLLTSGDSLNRVLLWDAMKGIDEINISQPKLAAHTGTVSTLAYYTTEDGTFILSSGFDAKIVRWRLIKQ